MYAFGWWVKDLSARNNYQLYVFNSIDFIRGFISICSAFGVDFRDYILGGPFTYHDYEEPPIYYDIEGYDI